MSKVKSERSAPMPSLSWTLAIVSLGLFMTTLDNLVVTTALPSIRRSLGASIQSLEWTVNAYTLTFAVLLLTGAALGDRLRAAADVRSRAGDLHGRQRRGGVCDEQRCADRRPCAAGTRCRGRAPAHADAALRGVPARAARHGARDLGRRERPRGGTRTVGRGRASISGISWHWIFWINVPVGLVLIPLALTKLNESHGPSARLDLPGLALAAPGCSASPTATIRGQALGWTSATIIGSFAVGVGFVVAFVAWELRAPAPMLPMRFFRSRTFAATNGLSFAMYAGVFGSIFLLAQFFQTTQGYTPLQAGLRTLPWTGMPMIVAPIAGIVSDRIGPQPLMAIGLTLQATAIAWLGAIITPNIAYGRLIVPFMLAGTGMALVFAPSANAVLSSVRAQQAGQASGATNAIRELGGVIGVAVLASVFSAHGSYISPQTYTAGLTAALPIGAVVLGVGAVLALLVPRNTPAQEPEEVSRQPRDRVPTRYRAAALDP